LKHVLYFNKTGGNAIRLKLTDLQPALKNMQKTARGKVRSSWNQDCDQDQTGARNSNFGLRLQLQASKIFRSGSKNFSLRLQNIKN